ncbi:hypothetical protein FOCC_FOCC001683 [Frankliniella occidentalis]|nr:hypothetical protein FOCC_FOCC001683 [Frankliniella occidentalis]
MNLSPKKSILQNLIHGFRLSSNEGFHSSRFVKDRNYYEVLNLNEKCNAKEIRDSFIRLAKKCHPDTNQNDPKSHARFVELQKAYTVLSTPSKRREYDLGLSDVSISHNRPYRRPQGESNDARAYEDYFNDEFKDLFYRRLVVLPQNVLYKLIYYSLNYQCNCFQIFHYSRMRPNANPPRLRVGVLQITLLFVAFTTVGAVLQYYVIKQDAGQNFPKPSPVTYPDLSDRPFFLR